MKLSEYDKKILDALDTVGGFTTGGVARRVTPKFGNNNRQHSGAIRSWLVNLEKNGLVKRMDNQKPVCWIKMLNAEVRDD